MSQSRRQSGVSLLFALMALIVMSIAAIAVARAVGSGVLIIGNLGLKQDASISSARGTELAVQWLQANVVGGLLENDQADSGYYASDIAQLDATGNRTSSAHPMKLVKWNDACPGDTSTFDTCDTKAYTSPTVVNGNKIHWVITRLCSTAGPPAASNPCVRPPLTVAASSTERGEVQPASRLTHGGSSPFFRIIVRVDGPRNTVSVTESLIHF